MLPRIWARNLVDVKEPVQNEYDMLEPFIRMEQPHTSGGAFHSGSEN